MEIKLIGLSSESECIQNKFIIYFGRMNHILEPKIVIQMVCFFYLDFRMSAVLRFFRSINSHMKIQQSKV